MDQININYFGKHSSIIILKFILLSNLFLIIHSCINENSLNHNNDSINANYQYEIDQCFIIGKSEDTLNKYSIILSFKNDNPDKMKELNAGFLKRPHINFKDEYAMNKYSKIFYWTLSEVNRYKFSNDSNAIYLRCNFNAINPDYHSLITIYKTHKEILESDFACFLFYNETEVFYLKKSKNFKIKLFYFDEEVSPDDERIKEFW